MIAVDTSALMAIVLDEPKAHACIAVLAAEDELLISAGTMTEALIVATRRKVGNQMIRLLNGMDFTVVNVTSATAHRIWRVYEQWGKGIHPASLNFGDCFSYDVAKEHSCRLLFVGNDFTQTDLESAL